MPANQKWTHEETVLALALYFRTQFGRITSTNPDIISLAKLMGRTPGSVAMKMCNLASCDPTLLKSGRTGLTNCSKMDRSVFKEYSDDLETLAFEEKQLRSELSHCTIEELLKAENPAGIDSLPDGEERQAIIKNRIEQDFFRTAVLTVYNSRCCITGLSESEILTACHIKPWADCDAKKERLSPQNGLCLNYIHGSAFERGLITVDSSYRIVISRHIRDAEMDDKTREWFMGYEHKKIILPSRSVPTKEFLEYHNDVVFQK